MFKSCTSVVDIHGNDFRRALLKEVHSRRGVEVSCNNAVVFGR